MELKKKLAFTLAEIIIVMGIIGIIAEFTIPILIANVERQETLVKIKKNYSVLSNAASMGFVADGGLTTNDVGTFTETMAFDYFINHFKTLKTCRDGSSDCGHEDARCVQNVPDLGCGPAWLAETPKAVLADGTIIYFTDGYNQKDKLNTYIYILFDVNGNKKPNRVGWDIFGVFYNTENPNIVQAPFSEITESYNPSSNDNKRCAPNGSGTGIHCLGQIIHDNWEITYW